MRYVTNWSCQVLWVDREDLSRHIAISRPNDMFGRTDRGQMIHDAQLFQFCCKATSSWPGSVLNKLYPRLSGNIAAWGNDDQASMYGMSLSGKAGSAEPTTSMFSSSNGHMRFFELSLRGASLLRSVILNKLVLNQNKIFLFVYYACKLACIPKLH